MSYTQDFFTSRNNLADGETKIGQVGRLWYDPDTNSIRVSDGVTPGGIFVGTGSPYSLPVASTTTLGGVKVDGTTITIDPITGEITSNTGGFYTLPAASDTALGGIIVGSGLTISETGVVSVNEYVLPTASTSVVGGVKVDGTTITINNSVISAQPFNLPFATDVTLGGIKVGSGLNITNSGVLSAVGYTLPIASPTIMGGIKVGSGLSIDQTGTLNANIYTLPIASATDLGGVKVDSTTIMIDQTGKISYTLPTASASILGGIKVGNGLVINGAGQLSTSNNWVMSLIGGLGIQVSSSTGNVTINSKPATTGEIGAVKVDNSTIAVNDQGLISVITGGIVGTVKNVSVNSANGFSGNVSSASSEPNITLNTTVTGIIKGSNNSLVAAIPNTDYQIPVTLTTNNTTGSATFTGSVLNIPQYQGALTLTTNETSGPATFYNNTINIPNYGSVTSVRVESTDLTVTGEPIIRSGTFNLSLNTVPIAKGGTGQTSRQSAINSLTDIAGSEATTVFRYDGVNAKFDKLNLVTDVTGVLPISKGGLGPLTPNPGYLYYNGTSMTTFSTISSSQIAGDISGNSNSINSILPISKGGTGETTAESAANALLPSQVGKANKVLGTDGDNLSWIDKGGIGTVTSINISGGTTGLITSGGPITSSGTITLGGILSIENGGTGAASASDAINNLLPNQNENTNTVLSTNGQRAQWVSASSLALPRQTNKNGLYLKTNGSTASWETVTPNPAGLNRQLQFNNSGVFSGTGKMFYNAVGELILGSGSSDDFNIRGNDAVSNLFSGTSIEIKAGSMFPGAPGQIVPPAGNINIKAGSGISDGSPGYISFFTGPIEDEVFRITKTGAWTFDGTNINGGNSGQFLMSYGNSGKPNWTSLPEASNTVRGVIKIAPGSSGLILYQNPGTNPEISDTLLRTNITEVDGYTISRTVSGLISVDTSRVGEIVIPREPGDKDKYLSYDGQNLVWTSFVAPEASSTNLGLVSIDNYTIKKNFTFSPTGPIYADRTAILPPQSGKQGYFLASDGSDVYWESSTYILPTASSTTLGGVKIDTASINISSGGAISVSAERILPSQLNNQNKFLSTNGTQLSWEVAVSPPATASTLGSVAVDTTTLNISNLGLLSANINKLLPSQAGKVNNFLCTNNGSLSWTSETYVLPKASLSALGGIKIDGDTNIIDTDGRLIVRSVSFPSIAGDGQLLFNDAGRSQVVNSLILNDLNRLTIGLPTTKNVQQTFNLIAGKGVDLKIKAADANLDGDEGYSAGKLIIEGGNGISIPYRGTRPGEDIIISAGAGALITVPGSIATSATTAGDLILRAGLGVASNLSDTGYGGDIILSTALRNSYTERFRITNTGAWSIGSDSASFGSAGQPLVSNGNAQSPSWGVTQIVGGGTGADNRASAINNLLPPQVGNENRLLVSNGTDVRWASIVNGGLLPTATDFVLGCIRTDGITLNVNSEGVVNVNVPGLNAGTVKSIDVSGGSTGLTAIGGPVTSNGTITLSGVLNVNSGGTGGNSPISARTNILPPQAGNINKSLVTDGNDVYWDYPPLRAFGERGQLQYKNNNDGAEGTARISYNGNNLLTLGIPHDGNPNDSTFNIVGADSLDALNPSDILIRPGSQTRADEDPSSLYIQGGSGLAGAVAGGNVFIDGGFSASDVGGSIIFRTSSGLGSPLSERISISENGAIGLNGNYGQLNQVLTSRGPGTTPIWRLMSADAGGLSGNRLASTVLYSSLTTLGTLSELKLNGNLGIGTTTPRAPLSVSLGNANVGIELQPSATMSTISSIDRASDEYTNLALSGGSITINTGDTSLTTRLVITNRGGWQIAGSQGQEGDILTSNGFDLSPQWTSKAPYYQEFIATEGQTVFNTTSTTKQKTADRAYLQVFINGVLQKEGSTKSYTVTGVKQITFNQGLRLNDDIAVYSFA